MKFVWAEGATPIDADAAAELIHRGITTQAELNELEHYNIIEARRWALRLSKSRLDSTALTPAGLKVLHRNMFRHVWKWAGKFRKRDLNMGCPWFQVEVQVQDLCADVRAQIDSKSVGWDAIAASYHHRLVSIHPFINGNGRHAREAANILLRSRGKAEFSWGSGSDLIAPGDARKDYLAALREADACDLSRLLAFARS